MLRMYWALSGISSCSAFSTARTEAMACTVVHTPQMRWVIAQASRGSRPSRISLDAAPHLAGRPGLLDLAAVDFDVDAQMAFDAGDRIDRDSLGHLYSSLKFSGPQSLLRAAVPGSGG